ncbi:hypothetical protein CBR_g70719 [Chara braunii]|uniref:CUE domain-containing protein n=1 Tax=Chara braunii TaxID=69332 RepID=A0A388K9Z5_CHABU|nr:hypothetical protein CBR_g70719 [Chara braunii]|eukprot:GBG66841.1 hypothetical protein CBR_g70719 [Chara braunii]
MSAVVCGKRSYFEDLHGSPPTVAKRLRCGGSPSRFASSPPPLRTGYFAGAGGAGTATSPSRSPSFEDNLLQLRSFFPDMEQQLIERILESSGNDLDSAIRSLTELKLRPNETADQDGAVSAGVSSSPSSARSPAGAQAAPTVEEATQPQLSSCAHTENGNSEAEAGPSSANDASTANVPEGMEWVEVIVREMYAATNIQDARSRVARILEGFERLVRERGGAAALEKENASLKEHIQALLKDNTILKRAVATLHHRQQEHEERAVEVQQLKQLIAQYQEQLRALEISNYTLSMHLRKAQEHNAMPGRFHPDVF